MPERGCAAHASAHEYVSCGGDWFLRTRCLFDASLYPERASFHPASPRPAPAPGKRGNVAVAIAMSSWRRRGAPTAARHGMSSARGRCRRPPRVPCASRAGGPAVRLRRTAGRPDGRPTTPPMTRRESHGTKRSRAGGRRRGGEGVAAKAAQATVTRRTIDLVSGPRGRAACTARQRPGAGVAAGCMRT